MDDGLLDWTLEYRDHDAEASHDHAPSRDLFEILLNLDHEDVVGYYLPCQISATIHSCSLHVHWAVVAMAPGQAWDPC